MQTDLSNENSSFMKGISIIHFTFCFMLMMLSENVIGQMSFNKHNPYVTNSEIHKLRDLKIDLFDKPILDEGFQKNVKLLLADRLEYNNLKRTKTFATVVGVLGASIFTAGLLTGKKRSITTFDLKDTYKQVGIVVGGIGAITFLINKPKLKLQTSKFRQQLKITKGQYDVMVKQ